MRAATAGTPATADVMKLSLLPSTSKVFWEWPLLSLGAHIVFQVVDHHHHPKTFVEMIP
jgi:hypothetical protein